MEWTLDKFKKIEKEKKKKNQKKKENVATPFAEIAFISGFDETGTRTDCKKKLIPLASKETSPLSILSTSGTRCVSKSERAKYFGVMV